MPSRHQESRRHHSRSRSGSPYSSGRQHSGHLPPYRDGGNSGKVRSSHHRQPPETHTREGYDRYGERDRGSHFHWYSGPPRSPSYDDYRVSDRYGGSRHAHGQRGGRENIVTTGGSRYRYRHNDSPDMPHSDSRTRNLNMARNKKEVSRSNSSSSSSPMHRDDNKESDKEEEEDLTEEQKMQKLMGINSFDSSKGKSHVTSDRSGVNKRTKRKYRQYMNRKGGFNRPLSPTY